MSEKAEIEARYKTARALHNAGQLTDTQYASWLEMVITIAIDKLGKFDEDEGFDDDFGD